MDKTIKFSDFDADFSKAGNYAEDLDRKSRAAMSFLTSKVRVKHKTEARTEGTAAIISAAEAAGVGKTLGKTLGMTKVEEGDVMLLLDGSTPFFIKRALFDDLYEIQAT